MSSGTPDTKHTEGARLGGARADFVASLGRKVHDARGLLATLEDDPSSRIAREELRRRLHALGAGARLLRLDSMAKAVGDALGVIDRGAQQGALRELDVSFVGQTLDDLPALAWGEAPARGAEPMVLDDPAAGEPQGGLASALPVTALVVGGEELAAALANSEAPSSARSFECERVADVGSALERARMLVPDVVVVDADLPRAVDAVATLLEDPLTEPVPIVVVGELRQPEESARFVALGVSKALPKPVAPGGLRSACDEVLDARDGRTLRMTLGEPTLEQLAERLSEQLKQALLDSVDRLARSCRVPLGEGTEVLGALWGAIARVQEIITQKTEGAVRFRGDTPEGAVALAPWLHQDLGGADRLQKRGRGAAAEVPLQGRSVLVADDDPGVTWFIADLLRTAGCRVHEALDGAIALDVAFRVHPELVVSDILMPGMDGFALSRAIRRDVALRDTPVILLSWKEDLLQRVRELGANAAAYLRKESDSRAILARVREVLRPRARIESRLRGEGEARGRLDELTPRLLLELVGDARKNARVVVRDATHLYEVEVRAGAPRKVTQTALDGGSRRGERALAALLGVGSGRFVVSASEESVDSELAGTLSEQIERPIAAARGALVATTGALAMTVERIAFDHDLLEGYLRATPDPARSIIMRLAQGASPRQMLIAGEVAPTLLEDVLADLAARDAVRAVEGAGGTDVLTPAVEASLAVLRGAPRPSLSLAPFAGRGVSVSTVVGPARSALEGCAIEVKDPAAETPYETLALSEPPPARPESEDLEAAPSSLEDALIRELSGRTPGPGAVYVSRNSNPPPIIEPSELRRRSSSPPAGEPLSPPPHDPDPITDQRVRLPSIPPDAIVPGASSSEEVLAAPVAAVAYPSGLNPAAGAVFAVAASPPGAAGDVETGGASEVAGVARVAFPAAPGAREQSSADLADVLLRDREGMGEERAAPGATPRGIAAVRVADASKWSTGASSSSLEAPPAPAASAPTRVRRSLGWSWPVALVFFALAAAIIGVLYGTGDGAHDAGATVALRAPSGAAAPAPTPVDAPALPPAALVAASPPADEPGSGSVSEMAAPPAAGLGLLVVTAPAGARVYVDDRLAGSSHIVSSALAPGRHAVRVERGNGASRQVVEVRAGETTRVRIAPVP